MKIIISNGHSKFILGPAATEAEKRGCLTRYITGGYPTQNIKKIIYHLGLGRFKSLQRLLFRQEEIRDCVISPIWLSEFLFQAGVWISHFNFLKDISYKFNIFSMQIYGFFAKNILKDCAHGNIYHFRSGYGHSSIAKAKILGMVAICDHSIAHPEILEYLVDNSGVYPEKNLSLKPSEFWQKVLSDLRQSDFIIANSDFVKETCIYQGCSAERIYVAYTGVDNEFMNTIPTRQRNLSAEKKLKLCFAGDFGRRKGAAFLIEALMSIGDMHWEIEIIGDVDKTIKYEYPQFFNDARVTFFDFMPRHNLAKHFTNADIFIFPSLAEGSARVIFMAMACGCYVITTKNSGSIVEDGVHGSIVSPGDARQLENTIRSVLATRREEIYSIGEMNAALIEEKYRQKNYGDQLFSIYEEILSK
ncbi:glycosyltransferase family 4 protein [Polynucleobacter paneuropaeus]|nr:glycosyltransferase family 4 protein [Polynucleobacter paneuropaeus]MBT8599718.1 glycosyltransferase family 4 protein [Polynucleobacter paneuropaeus]